MAVDWLRRSVPAALCVLHVPSVTDARHDHDNQDGQNRPPQRYQPHENHAASMRRHTYGPC